MSVCVGQRVYKKNRPRVHEADWISSPLSLSLLFFLALPAAAAVSPLLYAFYHWIFFVQLSYACARLYFGPRFFSLHLGGRGGTSSMLMWVIQNMPLTQGDWLNSPFLPFCLTLWSCFSLTLLLSRYALLSLTQVFGLLLSFLLFPLPPLSVCKKWIWSVAFVSDITESAVERRQLGERE